MWSRRFYPEEMLLPSPSNVKYTIWADGKGYYYLSFGEWLPGGPGRIILRHSELTNAAYRDFSSQHFICLYWWIHSNSYGIENTLNYIYSNRDNTIYNVPIIARLFPDGSGVWRGKRITERWEDIEK